jgi:hypothetical protein
MTANIHCPMIHGGLTINLKNSDNKIFINQCCLRFEKMKFLILLASGMVKSFHNYVNLIIKISGTRVVGRARATNLLV